MLRDTSQASGRFTLYPTLVSGQVWGRLGPAVMSAKKTLGAHFLLGPTKDKGDHRTARGNGYLPFGSVLHHLQMSHTPFLPADSPSSP